jgi:secreted PhoX family phosphatase
LSRLKIVSLAAFLVSLVALSLYLYSQRGQPKSESGPMGGVAIRTMPPWFLQIQNQRTGEVKSELRAWKFSEEGVTCFIFVQSMGESLADGARVPTASCLPTWIIF